MASTPISQYHDSDMQMFHKGHFSDVVVKCGDRAWMLHKSILASRSKWFSKVIKDQAGGPSCNLVTIKMCGPNVAEVILRYIYGGTTEFHHLNEPAGDGAVLLMYTKVHPAARYFGLPTLANLCLDKVHTNLNLIAAQLRGDLPTGGGEKAPLVQAVTKAIRNFYAYDHEVVKKFSDIGLLRAEFVHFVCDVWEILRRDREFLAFMRKEVPNFALDVGRTWQKPEGEHQEPDRCPGV
ncbi:BTB/POZ protein [Chaetomium sp. MPI-SDFR-AT-0129]|nr:BTB/POZ protein [Chaetomium sp. MPI-SDFR-AT-0129]